MSGDRPQSLVTNREYYDQITSGCRCTEKLPSFLATHVVRGDDRVGPPDCFFDLRRLDSMPGNMADVVQIPIEAFQVCQHKYSIYRACIYSDVLVPNGQRPQSEMEDPAGGTRVSGPGLRHRKRHDSEATRVGNDAWVVRGISRSAGPPSDLRATHGATGHMPPTSRRLRLATGSQCRSTGPGS